MAVQDDEEDLIRAVALRNSQMIQRARQEAEDALRRQSEWLQVTLGSIGDAVISTDAHGAVTFMNVVAEDLTGWPKDDALGRPLVEIFQIFNEHTREPVENPALRALREGTIVGLANHTVLIARDGRERPIDDSAAPMRDEGDVPVGAVLVFRDVTERKRAEEARARLAAIVESSHDAIVSKSLEGVILTWNAGAERLFGYSAAEVIGRPITLIIPTERIDEERAILERLRLGERVDHFETMRVAKDGRQIEISLTISPLRDEAGNVVGASKIGRDITAQKQAERALRESERRYRAIVEATPECVKVVQRDGTLLQMNSAGLSMIGATESEAIGASVYDLIAPEDKEAYKAFNERVCRGEGGSLEFDVVGLKGTRLHMDSTAVPLADAAGEISQLAVSRDVTERKAMERELRDADRRKDEFLAMLAHELRNPVAAIGNAVNLAARSKRPEYIEWSVEVIARQVKHLSRLIDDLLDVSRISRGKIELRRDLVDATPLLDSAVETARPFITERGHRLSVAMERGGLWVNADPTRLEQMIINLLMNAAKYTDNGGKIAVSALHDEDNVLISIKDNGVGIPPEKLPGMFELFAQGDRSLARSEGGLGIGLTIVKKLVEMHGGTVTAESEGIGKGSEFSLRIPAAPSPTRPGSSPKGIEELSRDPARIMVVDDNIDMATSTARLLSLLGHDVKTAYDGVQAIEVARAHLPDFILLDIGLPRMDGYEVARRLRREGYCEKTVLIAMSGYGQADDRKRSKEAGFDHHLVKPVDPDALFEILARNGKD